MTELILGLLSFAGLMLLWVVAPRRVINRHRNGRDGPGAGRVAADRQRVPQYWLHAAGGRAVPVFARSGAFVARVRGGPEIAGPTLAAVREGVSAYLECTDLRVRSGDASSPVATIER